jgi:glycine cleavage system H protein
MYPQEFLYSKEHTWVPIDEFLGTIGITEHAQKELGDIMYVALPKMGDRVMARESLGAVESLKAVSEIMSPVTGEVMAVNSLPVGSPEMVNADPHGA